MVLGKAEDRASGYSGRLVAERYRLGRVLAASEHGARYEAVEVASEGEDEDETSALQLFYADQLAADALETLERRAARLRSIAHPHLVPVLESGHDAALGFYVALPSPPALDLGRLLAREGALSPQAAVRLLLQAASGVAAAHAAGVTHGQLQPEQLQLTVDPNSNEVSLRVSGWFGSLELNSLRYAAPERARVLREAPSVAARPADEPSDVWALAQIIWHALSGQRPWAEHFTVADLLAAINAEPVKELAAVSSWVPAGLSRTVQRGLVRDPSLRPGSVSAFMRDLTAFSAGTDRVREDDLIGLTAAERGAVEVPVQISPTAAAGLANLARGGRGGMSLPPERATRSARPGIGTNSWLMVVLMIVVVGGLSLVLGYLTHRR